MTLFNKWEIGHTRDCMFRVLSSMSQFAHVELSDIERFLDSEYDRQRRAKEVDDGCYSLSVPERYLIAHEAGAPKLYSGESTIYYAMQEFGSVCFLCRSIGYDALPVAWPGLPDSCLIGAAYSRFAPAICCSCSTSIKSVWYKAAIIETYPINWTDDMHVVALAVLTTRDGFRKRVKENKNVRLRFNPRKYDIELGDCISCSEISTKIEAEWSERRRQQGERREAQHRASILRRSGYQSFSLPNGWEVCKWRAIPYLVSRGYHGRLLWPSSKRMPPSRDADGKYVLLSQEKRSARDEVLCFKPQLRKNATLHGRTKNSATRVNCLHCASRTDGRRCALHGRHRKSA